MILPPDFNPNDADVALLPSEIDRLRAQLDTWAKKSKQEKALRREELITEFLTARKLDPTNPWARGFLRGKISMWLSNRSGSRDSRLPKALKTFWSAREVFNLKEDARILERRDELVQGGKVPIAALNIARSELWNELTDDEQTEFMEKAEEWNEKGPDDELRAQIAEKRLGEWIQAIILWIHDQCGAMGRFEFCVLDKNEEMVHGIHDVSMIWHATNRNVPTYEQWRAKHQKRSWQEFCHACYHPLEQDDPSAPRATLPPHEFTFFDDGTPVLPPMEQFRHGTILKAVLHTFLSLHWEAASGIKNEPVAWQAVAKNTARFLPPDALPDEFVFQNPMRMGVEDVQQLWKHILKLQSEGETRQDRFQWKRWWKRVGKTGELHPAVYGQPPRPKHIAEGTRKTQAARNKRVPPAGAFGLIEATDPEDGSSTDEDGPTKTKGGRNKTKAVAKMSAPADGKKQDKGKGKANPAPKGKGKAKATDDSDSAKSSGVGSGDEVEPSLPSDGSPDSAPSSGEEENFNMDVTGFDDGLDDNGRPIPGPSAKPKPKPRPKRKGDGTNAPERPPDLSPERSPDRSPKPSSPELVPEDTPGPEKLPHIPGPWDDAPVGRHGLGSGRVPPRRVLVSNASGNPPSWVENDPDRVIPFLWSLNSEADYHAFLKSWRHMLIRRSHLRDPTVSSWANWDSDCWGIPAHYHAKRRNWQKIIDWIDENAPEATTECSAVQQWALVVGLALRDIYAGNDVEQDDPDSPVPYGGPEYLRHTTSLLSDALETILPHCVTSQHPELPMSSAGHGSGGTAAVPLESASTALRSRKETRILGKRGAPPGVRPAARAVKKAAKAKAQATGPGTTSADEVEIAMTGKVGSNTASAIGPASSAHPSRKLRKCFVEIPLSRHTTPARSRHPATSAEDVEMAEVEAEPAGPVPPPTEDVEMAEVEAEPADPVPPPLRRSSRKNKGRVA